MLSNPGLSHEIKYGIVVDAAFCPEAITHYGETVEVTLKMMS